MKYFTYLLIFVSVGMFNSVVAQQASSLTKVSYLQLVNKDYDVDNSRIYYVSNESKKDFFANLQPSILSFVKEGKSTSVDEIFIINDEGEEVSIGSCDAEKPISVELITNNFSDKKTYSGMVLKNLSSGDKYNFPDAKIVSVILFSTKMSFMIKPYISRAKRLYEKEGIEYIIVTMDNEELKEVKDIYANSFIN